MTRYHCQRKLTTPLEEILFESANKSDFVTKALLTQQGLIELGKFICFVDLQCNR